MINILRMQEILKGVPEEALIKEMQNPTGAAPLFLVASRLQEVKKLKEQYALEQQQADTTVAEDLVGAQPGPPVARPVGGARPPASMSPPPPGGPLPAGPSPVGPSPVAGLPPPSLPSPPPVRMESGGRIGYEEGGDININEAQFEKFLKLVQAEASDPETQRAVASVILNRLSVGQDFGNTLEEVMLKSGAFEPIGNIIKKKGKMDWDDLEAPSAITRDNIAKWFREGSQDPTDGALYFLNKALTDKRETTFPIFKNVDESQGLPEGTKRIGKMLFSKRWKADEDINRVEEALDTGKPTITVAGVDTAPITKPRDLISEIAAYSKAQPVNIPSDAGAAVDDFDLAVDDVDDAPIAGLPPAEAEKYITGVTPGGGQDLKAAYEKYMQDRILADQVAAAQGGPGYGPRPDYWGPPPGHEEDISPYGEALNIRPYTHSPGTTLDNQLAEASEMLIQQASNVPVQSDGGVSNQVAQTELPIGVLNLRKPPKRPPVFTDPQGYLAELLGEENKEVPVEAAVDGGSAMDRLIAHKKGQPRTLVPLHLLASQAITEGGEDVITTGNQLLDSPLHRLKNLPYFPLPDAKAVAQSTVLDRAVPSEVTQASLSDLEQGMANMPHWAVPGAGLSVYDDATSDRARTSGLPADNYLSGLEKSRDEAKGLGLLMAGLGMMGQASKPGATLLSSVPGAAAGVKTYMESSKDIRKTALEHEKMRRLAEHNKALVGSKQYQAIRTNLMESYSRDPVKSKRYGTFNAEGVWVPNAAFEDLVVQRTRTSSAADQLKAEGQYAKIRAEWADRKGAGGKWELARRKELMAAGKTSAEAKRIIDSERESEFNKWLRGIRAQLEASQAPASGNGSPSAGTRPPLTSPVFNKPS